MDISAFTYGLLLAASPVVLGLLAAAWLAGRRVGCIRLVDRRGRVLAEVILGTGSQ